MDYKISDELIVKISKVVTLEFPDGSKEISESTKEDNWFLTTVAKLKQDYTIEDRVSRETYLASADIEFHGSIDKDIDGKLAFFTYKSHGSELYIPLDVVEVTKMYYSACGFNNEVCLTREQIDQYIEERR